MDLIIILVIALIAVIIWRGPKTLPLLGKAFGQGVKEARKEMDEIKTDIGGKPDAGATAPDDTPVS
jgi:Sec-independent protein translocase protein TatA